MVLLLLMPVLTQAFFALVRCHLVSLSLFSAWHNPDVVGGLLHFYVTFYLVNKGLGRFKGRNIVGGDDDRCILRNVSPCLFSSFLDDETSESSQIDILTCDH